MQRQGKPSQRSSTQRKKYNELPITVTEKQFEQFFLPFLSLPKRSKKLKVPLHRIFNYITKHINLDDTNSIAKKGAKTLAIQDISIKQDRRRLA